MTNVYNGLIDSLEHALGKMQRTNTEQVLADLETPLSPEALLRHLHNENHTIRSWYDEQDIAPATDAPPQPLGKLRPEEPDDGRPKLAEAQVVARKLIAPAFARDTRTDYYTRTGGNIMAGITDLWVQKDPMKSGQLRQAHVVEYDLVNMEAVMMASEQMLGAIDEHNKGRKRSKTSPMRMTDGYIRVVNGLVYEAFAEALAARGIDDYPAHIHPVRLSNGDEFRLIVIGLDEDDIAAASKAAQEKVQRFIEALGLDALPHLKYLKDTKSWQKPVSLEDVQQHEDIREAMIYGGAGIKIGAAELGTGQHTSEMEHTLDMQMRESRQLRAKLREARLDAAIAASQETPPVACKPFNPSNKLAQEGVGSVAFTSHESFTHAMHAMKEDPYRGYYARPKVDILDFPYPLAPERRDAHPYLNPESYVDEFVAVTQNAVMLSDVVRTRFAKALEQDMLELSAPGSQKSPEIVASHVMKVLEAVLSDSHGITETQGVLKARAQFEEKRLVLQSALEICADTHNPYESFDLTRKRIMDKEAERLHLTDEQRKLLFYPPLKMVNARHEDGYCMSGRVRTALQIFQGNDQESRQFSYIGLSSFAGINEVSTALARSINDDIRHIASDELKKRFGGKVLDFAFLVESGRLNLLTHGIAKQDLTEALSAIEVRVDQQINQAPLGELLRRYRIFMKPSEQKQLVAKDEFHEDMRRLTDEVRAAQDQFGQDTPIALTYNTVGEVTSRALTPEECEQHAADIAQGKHLFLEERGRQLECKIPAAVETYLKSKGYSDDDGALDVSKPLSMLPNPKHTHEHGVRVVTAYVELLGNAEKLADQRKDELFRLVDVKKRTLYEPGKGYEVSIPTAAMPNLTTNGVKSVERMVQAAYMPGKFSTDPRNQPSAAAPKLPRVRPAKPFVPSDQAGWMCQLDQREFEMLQKRKVPETLMQMITDNYVMVEPNKGHPHDYVIKVQRQGKAYDREDASIPRRRAAFIKHALEEHFGNDVQVTGIPTHAKGSRSITMHVKPMAVVGKEKVGILPERQVELLDFLDALCAIKKRQDTKGTQKLEITEILEKELAQYRFQLRTINLLRSFPSTSIELPRNQGGNFIIKLPQEPGERKSVWKIRCDNLLKELQKLLSDKAIELEETQELPKSIRTGGGSTKSRIKYQIRVESTPVSDAVLNYMASIQQPESLRSATRA